MTDEDLEKKAEEYVPNIRWHDFSSKEIREEMKLCYRQGMKDGYEEGLKAKVNTTTISDCPIKDEWRYVSEKGTPKTEGHYLVCLRNKNKDILDCWILYDKDVGWYSMQIRIKDIYAWKEIVPPKLINDKED